MSDNNDSIERLELRIQKITQELTPETSEERKLLLNTIITQLVSEDIKLTKLDLIMCKQYVAGNISMRELSKHLLK